LTFPGPCPARGFEEICVIPIVTWCVVCACPRSQNRGPHSAISSSRSDQGGTLTIVDGKAENTAATINSVVNKILSPAWTDLTTTENAKASGYTHRSFRPDAVRYMSVTNAAHRTTATHPDS
jgi:hypothetical protein